MKTHWYKQLLSVVLVLALLVQLLPLQTLAATTSMDEEITSLTNSLMESEAPLVTVVCEEETLRTETEKHFRMSDGSFMAVSYGTPVHYMDDDGTWQDIDNTLSLSDDQSAYCLNNAQVSTMFAGNLSGGEVFTTSYDGTSVSISLMPAAPLNSMMTADQSMTATMQGTQGELTVYDQTVVADATVKTESVLNPTVPGKGWTVADVIPETLQSSILYEDVFPNVDLLYTAYGYNIKEQIIVNAPQAAYRYDFELELDGVEAVLNEDGSVSLLNDTSEVIYYIPAPFMEDANGELSYDVFYSLADTANGVLLSVEADAEWLNAEDRAYPVAIDPTIEVGKGRADGDIYAQYTIQGNPDVPIVPSQYLELGYTQYNDYQEYRGFMHFNNMPEIPTGAVITDALFGLYMVDYDYTGLTELGIGAYEVTGDKPETVDSYSDWISNLTWNTMPTHDTSNLIDYTVVSDDTRNQYCYWDLSELVKKWYTEATPNRTIAMTINAGTYSNTNYAKALFCRWASDSNRTPMLFVSYRSVLGIEDYYTYATLDAGEAGTVYISDFTGQMTVTKELVSYASTINPFAMKLVYNSNYSVDDKNIDENDNEAKRLQEFKYGSIRAGWTMDVLQTIETNTINDSTYLKYRDGDGTVHYFQTDPDSTDGTVYYDEDGLGLEIVYDETEAVYTMSDAQDNTYTFRNGVLEMMQDNNGNRYIYHYENDKLTSIGQKNNGATEEITVAAFTYANDFLTSVTDAAGRVYILNYTDNKLTSISRDGTVLVQYVYSGNNLVGAVDSESGYSLNFSYDTQSRVSGYRQNDKSGHRVAEAAISYVAFEKTLYRDYGNDCTGNTSDDILTYYLFDNSGRTVNAYSTDANGTMIGASNAIYYSGAATDKRNNRTLRTASIGVAAQQELRNSSFDVADSSNAWTFTGGAFPSLSKPRTGTTSLKFIGSSPKTVSKSQSLEGGQAYTLSCYINTTEMTVMPENGIYLLVQDENGNSWKSDYFDYQTAEEVDNGWMRMSVSFTTVIEGLHTFSICSSGGTGTLCVDDFQLEKGSAPSNRNMLENGDFAGVTYGWSFSTGSYPTFTQNFSGAAAAIVGSPSNGNARATQNVSINLSGAETYVLSGWAKGNSVPDNVTTAEDEAQDTEKSFGLRATVNYEDGTKEYFYAPFNADLTDWQFTSLSIVPTEVEKTVSTITVACVYEKNGNMAYFDNISLVRQMVQTMRYDDDGNLTSVSTTGVTAATNTYEDGNLTETVTGDGNTYSFTYDETYAHRLLSYTDGSTTQSMTYDGVGNVTSSSFASNEADGRGLMSSSSYSADGNRTTVSTDENNISTTYGYDTALSQMLGAATTITDANNTVTTVTYDDFGRTTQNGVANQATLTYTYDDGNLSAIKRETGNGNVQNYELFYNSFGNLEEIGVGGYPLKVYTYPCDNGLPDMQVYGNMDTFIYTYDDLGRIKTETYPDGRVVTYIYNGEGQIYSVKETGGDSPATYLYTYDGTGNLVSSEKKNQNGNTVLRVYQNYDGTGQLEGQSWYIGDTSYSESYIRNSTDDSLNTMITATGETIQFSYDDLQRLTATGNGLYTKNYSYRNLSGTRTTNQVSQVQYTGLPTALNYGYTYDSLGNIATYSAPGKETVTYTYDALGQLLSAVGSQTYTYTYDSAGNILTANGHTYIYGDSGWKDLLTAYDGETISYDAIGNPYSYYNGTRWDFSWENGRSLATANNGTTCISYTYDANGLRTGKTVGNVTCNYLYDSGQLLRETYGDNVLDFFYDASGQPYSMKYNGTSYYYITNLQGDVMYLVDAQGNTVASYDYDPYGNIISATGSMAEINPLRYRGYYYDAELEMYYLQSRYYDPQIGRFINADESDYLGVSGTVLSYNLFSYCEGNPISHSDATGNFVIRRWMVAAVIDFILMAIPAIGSAFAPIKAIAKAFSKAALKTHIKTPLVSFIKFVSKSATTILKAIQKGLATVSGVGKWLAKKIPVTKIASGLAGLVTSVIFNKVLNTLIENVDIVLSVGGAISGILDVWCDKKLDNRLWVI